jgi:hypothetical protein
LADIQREHCRGKLSIDERMQADWVTVIDGREGMKEIGFQLREVHRSLQEG